MVRPERVELPTFWFVARRSIQLSYGRTDCGFVAVAVAYRNFLAAFNMDFRYAGVEWRASTQFLRANYAPSRSFQSGFLRNSAASFGFSSRRRALLTVSSARFYCELGIKNPTPRPQTWSASIEQARPGCRSGCCTVFIA